MNHSERQKQSELISAEQAGAIVGVSKWAWFKYARQELVPAPVQFAGRHLWRKTELYDWIASGCPARKDWQWVPAQWQTLEERVRQKQAELAQLQQRIKEANAELDRMEKASNGQ
jgi:predicted DNA-binding transcriptional regulator AlpA